MSPIIRITKVEIKNLKNIKYGSILTNSSFECMDRADVIGIYGQNGSGKTAVVEAFYLLSNLIQAEPEKLPLSNQHLHYFNESKMKLLFEFNIENELGEFYVRYHVTLAPGKERIHVTDEKLSYRENIKRKRFKTIVDKKENDIYVRTYSTNEMDEHCKISILVANKLTRKNYTSFIFLIEELSNVYDKYLNDTEKLLVKNIKYDFWSDFHVIRDTDFGLLIANIMLPFSVHLDNVRGQIPYDMRDNMLVPKEIFSGLEYAIEQINVVLNKIIPGLFIEINILNEQKLDDGTDGIRFEFLSRKNNITLPLRVESAGTLKIISILSTLIAVYNNPNACVVIDELDAAIYEFLLGEVIEVLHENGKGQLIFTSHNLRILEVLPVQNLWFSTTNEDNRFIQLKGVKQTNNIRDTYIRSIQLGGQEEEVYNETDAYEMKKHFRKAGRKNV